MLTSASFCKAFGAIAIALSASTFANTTIISFEGSIASDAVSLPMTPYSESGYHFTNSVPNSDGLFGSLVAAFDGYAINGNGSTVLGFCSSNTCHAVIDITSSSPFTLLSFDAARFQLNEANSVVEVRGHVVGGNIVHTSFILGRDWKTNSLSGFIDLTSVEFFGQPGNDVAMDNIRLTAVPEASTFILSVLGLLFITNCLQRRNKIQPVIRQNLWGKCAA